MVVFWGQHDSSGRRQSSISVKNSPIESQSSLEMLWFIRSEAQTLYSVYITLCSELDPKSMYSKRVGLKGAGDASRV